MVALQMSGNEITDTVRAAGTSGDGLPAPDSSTGIWRPATNLIANGTAGATTGFGNNDGVALVSRDPATPIMGTSSLQVTTQPGVSGVRTYSNLVPYPTLAPGLPYTGSVFAKIPNGVQAFLTVADTSNGFSVLGQAAIVGTGSIIRYQTTFTPASAASASIMVTGRSGTGAFTFWAGGFQLEQNPYATPYIRTTTTTSFRPQGRVQLPPSLVSSSQGWFAARIRPGFPATDTGSFHTIANFGNTFQDTYDLTFRTSVPRWKMEVAHNGSATAQGTFAAAGFTSPGDQLTVVGTWTVSGGNATVQVYVNGVAGTPQTGAQAAITGTPTFDLGTQAGGQLLDGDILWFAAGTGTLTASDTATITSWGATDPTRAQFPAAAQATVVWDGASANASLK